MGAERRRTACRVAAGRSREELPRSDERSQSRPSAASPPHCGHSKDDTVLITRFDRLVRSTRDLLNILDTMAKTGQLATDQKLTGAQRQRWMDAWRPVNVAAMDHQIVEFEDALQVELFRVRFGKKNEGAHTRFNRAVECLNGFGRFRQRWVSFELSREYVGASTFRFLRSQNTPAEMRKIFDLTRDGKTVDLTQFAVQGILMAHS